MIDSSSAYKLAVYGDTRRVILRAVIDISSPDIVFGVVNSDGEADISVPGQVHDHVFEIVPYATLEWNRFILNGEFKLFLRAEGDQVGFIGDSLSKEDGTFSSPVYVEETFSNVLILQACSVIFPTAVWDGYPVDFKIEVKQGGTAYFTKEFKGNTKREINVDGFTVNNPDAIRVTVTKWSLPYRRLRVVEIIPGIYEEWDGNVIAEFSLKHQGDISCLSLPYGTCTIKMDNLDRRFEPRNKAGVFKSIEERQAIDVSMAVRLPDGTDEYKRVGMFYQYSGGWKTSDNGLTMQWDLVDIIGLLQSREFIVPDSLPETLEGWVAAIVAQLGVNFESRYIVDSNYADTALIVSSAEDVSGVTCGDLLLWVCMASATWPRADAETGKLAVEPLWNQGDKITLENLISYPTMKANPDVAAIIFTLNDGNDTKYVISGNSTSSSETKSVDNPFIKTKEQALAAARLMLSTFGGNQYEISNCGNPASEVGDVDTIWLDESNATTARRIQQDLSFSSGVLSNCTSVLLQADGAFLFQNREIITSSGTWTAPDGVLKLRAILVNGGSGGGTGTDGSWDEAGTDGTDGQGGLVWAETIAINPNQVFNVEIGQGGAPGESGGITKFGAYSAADGQNFDPNYTDIASGDAFARDGVQLPTANTGDGGKGGAGGVKGNRREESGTDEEGNSWSRTVIDNYPGEGEEGVPGASGCVILYWDIQ